MVGASKILTVSYGTFSCTLEGFEEPFSTMKAIAEYFRDLAADDRYFGAEPPTPDAEMLHRIAEREIQRRVEAKISEHGIVLRADTDAGGEPAAKPAATALVAPAAAAVAPVAAPAAAEPAPTPVAETMPEEFGAEEDAGADVFAEYLHEEPEAAPVADRDETDNDSVASKLSRIRAVVAAAQAAPAAPQEDEETAADFAPSATVPGGDFGFELELDDVTDRFTSEPAAEEDGFATFEEIEEIAPVAEVEAEAEFEVAAEDEAEDVEAVVAGTEPDEVEIGAEAVEEEIAAEEAEPEAAATEEIFEEETFEEEADSTLADVVGHFEETEEDAAEAEAIVEAAAEEPEAEAEDIVAEEEVEATALDLGAWRLDAEDGSAAASDEAAEEAELEADEEDDLELEAAFEAEDELEDEVGIEAEAAEEDAEAAEETTPEATKAKPGFFGQAAARMIELRKSLGAARDEETAEDEVADEVAADDRQRDEVEERSAAIFAALTEEVDNDEDFDEAEEAAGEDADAALIAGIGAAIGDTGLDQDAEDDLLRELADVAREARRDSHEGRAILEGNAGDGDASVERLMEEAKSKLEGDESRRRFSAISHLKAAVAATVADRKLKFTDTSATGAAAPGEEIERYRDDLSKAVRPRRPAAESAPTTRRPTLETRQAPLVLVSEQRIDAPSSPSNDSNVVRPRRISAGKVVMNDEVDEDEGADAAVSPEEAKSFADFADRLGAVDLSDMLEAAAAYTATVEGLPHFSRPQILRKVAYVAEDEEYSREDGLRSFGMLLRQGKIQKISRGQFTITEASRFMSEARRAAR
ncbi:hypothetical protein [Defluviimonas sp. SAOS-178_SWC]|uniref:hypothetical protein n=1 Tax=Defluviimonas sp. SAOS-178_SWC TaxID=3121287 RepID=UPI003221799B